jgi:hypothetical protein
MYMVVSKFIDREIYIHMAEAETHVIYSTTVIGQDRRIAYNERNLRTAFPHATLVYLDMLDYDERQRVRATLVGGGGGAGAVQVEGIGIEGIEGAAKCKCPAVQGKNIRFPQLFVSGLFNQFGDGLLGR